MRMRTLLWAVLLLAAVSGICVLYCRQYTRPVFDSRVDLSALLQCTEITVELSAATREKYNATLKLADNIRRVHRTLSHHIIVDTRSRSLYWRGNITGITRTGETVVIDIFGPSYGRYRGIHFVFELGPLLEDLKVLKWFGREVDLGEVDRKLGKPP